MYHGRSAGPTRAAPSWHWTSSTPRPPTHTDVELGLEAEEEPQRSPASPTTTTATTDTVAPIAVVAYSPSFLLPEVSRVGVYDLHFTTSPSRPSSTPLTARRCGHGGGGVGLHRRYRRYMCRRRCRRQWPRGASRFYYSRRRAALPIRRRLRARGSWASANSTRPSRRYRECSSC